MIMTNQKGKYLFLMLFLCDYLKKDTIISKLFLSTEHCVPCIFRTASVSQTKTGFFFYILVKFLHCKVPSMRARWISPGVYLNTTQSLHCWALVSSVQWCSTWDPRCTQAWPRTGSTTSLTWQAMKCSCWTLPQNVLLFVNLIWPCFKYVNEGLFGWPFFHVCFCSPCPLPLCFLVFITATLYSCISVKQGILLDFHTSAHVKLPH